MDVNGSSRHRHVKSVPRARLLGVLPYAPPVSDSGRSSSTNTSKDDLTQNDIFWSDDLVAEDHHRPVENGVPRFSASASNLRHSHRKVSAFGRTDSSFVFLAALPDHEKHTVFNHKALSSISSAAASSSQMIPRRAQDRLTRYRSSASTVNYHQSAPVRVPMMPKVMIKTRRREFYEIDVDDEQGDDEMLPPHEMVSRTWRRSYSRIAAFSVLEGAGRTLKGRDLRQVRNAILQRTGFLD